MCMSDQITREKARDVIERRIELAAMTAHEVNRAYCASMGDSSQPTWKEAPQWQRDSAIAGVIAIQHNPDTTPEDSHKGWMAHKAKDGWAYGPVKDPDKKTHPCMVPYSELPPEQRAKDALFGAAVRAVLSW